LPECNFDDGDCRKDFNSAGSNALLPCDRSRCSYVNQNNVGCFSNCFRANCDFSRFLCKETKAALQTCPAFDAAALASYAADPRLNFPDPSSIKGSVKVSPGRFRGFGRCALNASSQCQPARQGSSQPIYMESAGSDYVAVRLTGSAGRAQSCSTSPGAYVCTPALSWAWADGTTPFTKARDTVSVQVSIRIDSPPSGKRSVVVSSETIAIGIARASNKSSDNVFLSVRAGDSDFVDLPECMLQVGVWHAVTVSFSLSIASPGFVVLTVYLNRSWVNVASLIPIADGFDLALASESGLAVGRDFPSAGYLTDISNIEDDSSSYFLGSIARLRLWGDGAAVGAGSLYTNQTCQEASAQKDLVACYDFNRSLEDFMHEASLQLRAGDRYRPWCTTVNDGGRFMFQPVLTSNQAVYDRGEQWGFCSQLYTLPSRERSYDPLEMEQIRDMHTADLFTRYRNCGRVPLAFINNRALSRHGGAVYTSGCTARNGACFLGLPAGLTPALQIVFAHNSAGASGGAVYIDSPTFPSSCAEILRQRLGLPSPHADLMVIVQDNAAGAWGDAFATQPSRIYVASGVYEYVPGIDALEIVAELADNFNQTVRGSSSFTNDYIVKVLSCVPNAPCSDRSGLGPSRFYGCDQSGQCRTMSVPTSVICLANHSEATVLVSYTDLISVKVVLRCLPCRQGQQIKLKPVLASSLSLLTWSCEACGAGMTVIEPNNPNFGCVPCPATAVCANGGPPVFDVTILDLTIQLRGNVTDRIVSSGLELALTTALSTLLPIAPQQVLLQPCTMNGGCKSFRRAQDSTGASITVTLRILQKTSTVPKTALGVASAEWRQNLSDWLVSKDFNLEVAGVQTAVISSSMGLGEWMAVGGTYILKSCPAGYLLVNSDSDGQQCLECDAGTYSLDSTDGCIDGICSRRPCTSCPAGASCARGSSSPWSHFVPRVLNSGSGPILSVTLVLPHSSYTLYYIDSPSRYIWTNASLLPSPEPDYAWEFVPNCTDIAKPCDPASAPSFVLRICPPGHTIENTSKSQSKFNQALQECVPCPAGQYVTRPSHPPCVDCPFGGRCQAGRFEPSVIGSVWEEVGPNWRIRLCPPGYVLVR
jgi:predicted outer membrane repeat protein